MFNPKLARFRPLIFALKVGECLTIEWENFVGGKPKNAKEKPMSNGDMTFVATPREKGMVVKRIE